LIVGKRIKVQSSASSTVYKVCDIDQMMPAKIVCDGVEQAVKVVLKIYARVPQSRLKAQRERKRYEQLLRGKPAWNHEPDPESNGS